LPESHVLTHEVPYSVRPASRAAATRLRMLGWVLLPVFMLVFWAGTADFWPFEMRFTVARLAYGTPVLLSIVFGVVAARISVGPERRFWSLLTVANSALFLSEMIYAWWILFLDPAGPPRIAWPFQGLHLIAAIAFIGVLATMTRFALSTTTAKLRYGADISILALVVYAFVLELFVRPLMEPAGAMTWEILVGAMYPVVAFLEISLAALNVAGLKMVKWRSWERLLMVALAVYVTGVALWPLWWVEAAGMQRVASRSAFDLVQLTGHYVLFMATIYRLTEGQQWFLRPLPPFTLANRRWLSAVFPALGLVAVGIVLSAAYLRRDDQTWLFVYGTMAALLMGLSLVRSSLTTLEHSTLFHRSITDPLTGLYNHRYFHSRLAEEVEAAKSIGDELSLVLVDVDDFGHINALYGHGDGDRLLASLGASMQRIAGPETLVARIGGDEFAIIVPEASAPDANLVAQRMIDIINIEGGFGPGTVSASAGVASLPEHGDTAEELFRLADCALLWAKERGKNRVIVFELGKVPDLTTRERIEFLERQSRLSSVRALAAAVDARDQATRFHSQSVASLAVRLAVKLGFDDEHIRLIGQAALMHDVGKIAVPDYILSKPGPLTQEERRRVQEHPVLGQRILSATELDDILPWVRAHHEHWDGNGYPDGRMGEEIPYEARMLSVCDAYDAMTSDRPYRNRLSNAAALQEIDLHLGTQFDPQIAETFICMLAEGADEGRLPYLDALQFIPGTPISEVN